jgi:hypothetical protein
MACGRGAVAVGLALGLAGCSTVSPFRDVVSTSRNYEYRGGTATRRFDKGLETIAKSKLAMDDVGIHSIREYHNSGAIELEGRTADNRRAVVSVNPQDTRSTVTIRVGLVGDEALSRAFLDRLAIQLGERSTELGVEEKKPRRPILSRDAVPDDVMLRNQADVGYKDSPIP